MALRAKGCEKISEKVLGLSFPNAVVNLGHVVGLGVTEYARALIEAAGFGIGSTIVEARNAGGRDCHRAHRAGFQRDVEIMICQAFGTKNSASSADGEDFGVRGWVIQLAGAISGAGDDFAVRGDDHCATGDFATAGGGAGLIQGDVHMAGELAHGVRFAL